MLMYPLCYSYILSYSLGICKRCTFVLLAREIFSHSRTGTSRFTSPERSGTSTPIALHRSMAYCVAVSTAKEPCEVTKEDQASMPCPTVTMHLVYFARGR